MPNEIKCTYIKIKLNEVKCTDIKIIEPNQMKMYVH